MGGMPLVQRSDMPKVAVVIPVLNEEAVIRRCLLAVLDQTVPAQQIIVVDNGSTDDTAAVVARIQQERPDSPLIVLNQSTEQGLIPARNAGLNAATAEVLGRIDADTVVAPDWVQRLQQAFLDPAAAAVTGPVFYYDLPLARLGLSVDDAGRRLLMQLAGRHRFLYGSNMAIRRSAWERIRSATCRDEADELHEDLDLSLHLSEHGLRITYIPTLVAGVSARRLNTSPEDFRHYVDRFHRTYHAHHVHHRVLKAPAIILWCLYRSLRLLRALRRTPTLDQNRHRASRTPLGWAR